MKPETIIEESEDSCDDDRTNPKLKFQVMVWIKYSDKPSFQ